MSKRKKTEASEAALSAVEEALKIDFGDAAATHETPAAPEGTEEPAEAAGDEATSQDPEADAPADADTQTSPEAADGGEPAAEAEEEA